MPAITWRELVGPPDTGAFRGLSAVGETINNSFDAVNRAIASRQQANQNQQDIGRQAGVAAYLDRVQQANTPEALAALQQSGELAGLRSKVDPRDLGLIRTADETRLSAVRANIGAAQKFAEDQFLETNKPLVTQLQTMAAQGMSPAEIAAKAGDVANHPIMAKVITDAVTAKQTAEANAAKVALEGAQTGQAGAETKAIPLRVQNEAERNRISERGNNIQLLTALETRLGGAGGPGAAGGGASAAATSSDVVTSTMNKVFPKDPDKAEIMGRLISQAQLHDDPSKAALLRNLPADALERVVKASSDMWGTGKWNPSDMGAAGRLQNLLFKQLNDPSVLSETIGNMQSPKLHREQAAEAANLRRTLVGMLVPGATAGNANGAAPGQAPNAGAPVAADLGLEGRRAPTGVPVDSTPPAPKGVPLADFKLDPELEKQVEKQQFEMGMGTRRLYTPEVEQYVKAKQAATDALDQPVIPGPNPAARAPQAAWSMTEAIARRQQDDATKKVR